MLTPAMDTTRICVDCHQRKFCCVLREVRYNKTNDSHVEHNEAVCPECVEKRKEDKCQTK